MKLVETSAELLPFISGEDGIYKMIERAGRTCYKSTDKMTDNSAKPFVERMIKSGHTAMLEHGTVYLKFDNEQTEEGYHGMIAIDRYKYNPYSKISYSFKEGGEHKFASCMYVTTNLRVLVENNWLDDLKYICEPTEFHEKRYTMRFTCSRAIANELVRHRVFSFAQESQRYINYSKERHGGEITYIIPSWFTTIRGGGVYKETQWGTPEYNVNNIILGDKVINTSESQSAIVERQWCNTLKSLENTYMFSIGECKLTPQQARDVLPNATKTELIMTGFSSDWRHVVDLRLFEKTGKVHPDMLDLMQKAQKVMQEAGIWDDIIKQPSKFE